ncbi:MAG: phosphate ABC transporter substrate-binding protein PstS [Myxococcales bacterium]|nr:phosphate ABC transporter substrate-binding protein PstS [Myxococcales bacterium]
MNTNATDRTERSPMWAVVTLAAALLYLVVAVQCKRPGSDGPGGNADSVSVISGAGATFPYPIYGQWAHRYHQLKKVKLNYQSIGSGGGIAQIKAKTVDFGASDKPLKPQELDKIGLIQFPMVIGGVVPVVNAPGIAAGKLKLTATLLAEIYLGVVTKWNDPKLVAANAGLTLPDKAITVVHRSDGSGTTWIFTNYLSKVSPTWKAKVGNGKAVKWPVGVGGKGNEGVASYVRRVAGSIGYVEFAYALQNKSGKFVGPSIESFQAAAANANWGKAPGFYLVLTDQPGAESWPITGASFILLYKKQRSKAKAIAMLRFFDWCLAHGSEMAKKLHYVPIPANVVDLIRQKWQKELSVDGKPVLTSPQVSQLAP